MIYQTPISISQGKVKLASGIEIAFREAGQGNSTILMVHGMGSEARAWDKNMTALGREFRCIAIDLPNYGGSSRGLFPFTSHFFSEIILEVIEAMEIGEVILVGHSMGGQAVLRTLVDHPEVCKKAILVAPAGLEVFDEQEIEWLKKKYTPNNLLSLSKDQTRRNVEINFFRFPADAQFMVDKAQEIRNGEDYKGYCQMIPRSVLGMVQDRINDDLGKVRAEVLVLFGREDALIPHPVLHAGQNAAEMAQKEVEKLPNGKLVVVENCGHFLQWEQAERFNQETFQFLQSTP